MDGPFTYITALYFNYTTSITWLIKKHHTCTALGAQCSWNIFSTVTSRCVRELHWNSMANFSTLYIKIHSSILPYDFTCNCMLMFWKISWLWKCDDCWSITNDSYMVCQHGSFLSEKRKKMRSLSEKQSRSGIWSRPEYFSTPVHPESKINVTSFGSGNSSRW